MKRIRKWLKIITINRKALKTLDRIQGEVGHMQSMIEYKGKHGVNYSQFYFGIKKIMDEYLE